MMCYGALKSNIDRLPTAKQKQIQTARYNKNQRLSDINILFILVTNVETGIETVQTLIDN